MKFVVSLLDKSLNSKVHKEWVLDRRVLLEDHQNLVRYIACTSLLTVYVYVLYSGSWIVRRQVPGGDNTDYTVLLLLLLSTQQLYMHIHIHPLKGTMGVWLLEVLVDDILGNSPFLIYCVDMVPTWKVV